MDTLKLTAETSKWDIRRKTALNINLYIQLMTHVGSERRGLRPLQWRPAAEELSSVGVGVACQLDDHRGQGFGHGTQLRYEVYWRYIYS